MRRNSKFATPKQVSF